MKNSIFFFRLLAYVERFIKEVLQEEMVISMYTKSEITEISVEIDQCMCCAEMAPIIGVNPAV